MESFQKHKALAVAVRAARAAGALMRRNLHAEKKVNEETPHDLKLELDVRCQKLIERMVRRAFPDSALLGEEGDSGDATASLRWVVDPIDGTVNFAHGISHACVSIALQERDECRVSGDAKPHRTSHVTLIGVVYDPFTNELWTAIRGQAARLNGRTIRVSRRRRLEEAIVSIGFSKSRANLEKSLPYFCRLARRTRKVRIMGSAALALVYVASGRFDAYIERQISLWDIAAGALILECAGGKFSCEARPGWQKFRMIASNGLLHSQLPMPK